MHFLVDGCIYLISFLVNDFQSSEGTSLTQNDEKGYWGVISEVEDGGKGSRDGVSSIPANKKIEIHGAVMVGWGLEPCSVGRFKMIEIDELLEDDDDDGEAVLPPDAGFLPPLVEAAMAFDFVMLNFFDRFVIFTMMLLLLWMG